MRLAITLILMLVLAAFVSHTKIEFHPFDISCRYWYRGLGFILFIIGITLMQAGEYKIGRDEGFKEGVESVFKLLENKNNKIKE